MTDAEKIAQWPKRIPGTHYGCILQLGIQQGEFPFGVAVKMGKWRYYINTNRFINYMRCEQEDHTGTEEG